MEHPLLASNKVVLLDGAMGTEIQRLYGATECNEYLVITEPDLIFEIHRSYLAAGADVIETNTFGANAIVLKEHGLEASVFELNREAAALARRAVNGFENRFVAGSVGPGTKLPSLGQVTFRELYDTFKEQVRGLLLGGVDAIFVETCQDPLQAKAACIAAHDAMDETGRLVPLFVLFTFEKNGKMLLGTEPGAAVVTLANLPCVDSIGINCGVGPDFMYPVLLEMNRWSPLPLVVMPNAGLPVNEGGRLVYRMSPVVFASHIESFVKEFGVAFVGGCCGTTPQHIAALAEVIRGIPLVRRGVTLVPAVSSLYQAVTLHQEPRPTIIGERTNAAGSKEFRERLEAHDIEGMVAVAADQQREGAHLLDVSLAMSGRSEAEDAVAFLSRLREAVELPLVYDSTDLGAIEAALQSWPGRAVINSVNLEDGGSKLERIASIARRYGAALVALTIAEDGMAMETEKKVATAKRLVDILVGRFGFAPSDILVDPLTFTLASGDPSLRDSAVQTLDAIRRIKQEIPGALTSLGISNVSYGLKQSARRVLNSVFLHHAIEAGLDVAILNAGRVVSLNVIPEKIRQAAEDLLFGRYEKGDVLAAFIAMFEDRVELESETQRDGLGPSERLRRMVVRGERSNLEQVLDEALAHTSPMQLIDEVLIRGMREVGEAFGRGETQLPFVLRSAEVVKAAMSYLEPRLDRRSGPKKATIVLATVAGDVHDIGKNLVDILLSNNGYRVVNLGTRQPIEDVIAAAEREGAQAIGLSGLLVKSTLVMRDAVAEMRRRGIALPVLLGGAALTARFVEEEVRPIAPGPVFYCKDAFSALKVMDAIVSGGLVNTGYAEQPSQGVTSNSGNVFVQAVEPPYTPFFGTRVETPPLPELIELIDRVALFRGQWQFRKVSEEQWMSLVKEQLEPLLMERLTRYTDSRVLEPKAIWGFFEANSEGNTVYIWDETGGKKEPFEFPRRGGRCLADYVLPFSSGQRDVIGVILATVGLKVSQKEAELFKSGEYTEYLYLHGIGVELAEATAEWAYRKVLNTWGILGQKRGGRYSFGYAACPSVEDHVRLLTLIGAERLGVRLTETHQMIPEQTTAALVFHHPSARRG